MQEHSTKIEISIVHKVKINIGSKIFKKFCTRCRRYENRNFYRQTHKKSELTKETKFIDVLTKPRIAVSSLYLGCIGYLYIA